MEKIADAIEQLLVKKLALYKDLESVVEKEKTHVVSMDVEALWATISQKKSLLSDIQDIRQSLLLLYQSSFLDPDDDSARLDLLSIIRPLTVSPEKKAELKKTISEIHTVKQKISQRASENKHYINEHLAIIDGIFSTLTDGRDKKSYTPSGAGSMNNGKQCLFYAEV